MKSSIKRSAFTLVELLVVIAIITILASLITAGAFWALNPAKETAIKSRIRDIDLAIEDYAGQGGRGYFPTETISPYGKAAFEKHLRKAFRYHKEDFAALGGVPDLDASETLVYFLGGNVHFMGSAGHTFSIKKNTVNPISANGEIEVWFDFDVTRLSDPDNDGFYSYTPEYIELDSNAPLVYFAAADYGQPGTLFPPAGYTPVVNGVARPYFSSVNGAPLEAQRFQIVCAGQDGHFGTDVSGGATKQYPDGANYDVINEEDNITNFSPGRLGNELP